MRDARPIPPYPESGALAVGGTIPSHRFFGTSTIPYPAPDPNPVTSERVHCEMCTLMWYQLNQTSPPAPLEPPPPELYSCGA